MNTTEPIDTVDFEMETYIKCNWCHELFTEDELVHEHDLGYLCHSCVQAILSRGEHLTIDY